jgi:hypothetical protein
MAQGGVAFGSSLVWPLREVGPSFPENVLGGNWFPGGPGSDGFRERDTSTVMLESAFFGGIVRGCFNVTTSRLGVLSCN